MKSRTWLGALFVLALMAGIAYVGQKSAPAGTQMAAAAQAFLKTLSDEQRQKTVFDLGDKERTRWHFVPLQDRDKKSTRKGLPFEAMAAEQKKAAKALLAAGTSMRGYEQATTIVSLESVLHELEKGGTMVRNPGWYFVTIFGTPSPTGKWGWRLEGHHLSLNFTLEGGQVLSSTPAFFGANPAVVKAGPRKGLKTLADADELAIELFKSLDDAQRKVALQPKMFPEVTAQDIAPRVGDPVGLSAGRMTEKQLSILNKLIQSYATRMPADVAELELKRVHDAGIDKVHFGYAGGTEEGQQRTYRIQGPTFVIEFLNTQSDSARNPANHIHSCWRTLKGDFGLASSR